MYQVRCSIVHRIMQVLCSVLQVQLNFMSSLLFKCNSKLVGHDDKQGPGSASGWVEHEADAFPAPA